jgi:hypothetical protein
MELKMSPLQIPNNNHIKKAIALNASLLQGIGLLQQLKVHGAMTSHLKRNSKEPMLLNLWIGSNALLHTT